jgi:hypothetical protein
MITVSKAQLRQVEYLIQQSLQGNHVLFDASQLRAAMSIPEDSPGLDAGTVERHIENLITLPSLAQKRAYLERLETPEFLELIRSYFNIIENNLLERSEARH